MKRLMILTATLLTLLSFSVTATPATVQVIEPTKKDGEVAFVVTQPPTFGEVPTLRAGEVSTTTVFVCIFLARRTKQKYSKLYDPQK